ncbi:hypothetical protein GCM10009643_01590 [Microbacterium aurantiacum]
MHESEVPGATDSHALREERRVPGRGVAPDPSHIADGFARRDRGGQRVDGDGGGRQRRAIAVEVDQRDVACSRPPEDDLSG